MLNRIIVIGRLTKNPELRTTSNGISVTTFTLAVERNYMNSDGNKEVDFIPVITWRRLAESCSRYLEKGKLAAVEGCLQIRTYENDRGAKRTIAEIIADNVQFLSPKSKYNEPYEISVDEMEPIDDIPF